LWRRLNGPASEQSVHLQHWPEGDPEKAKEEEITVVVQVNGRVRDKLVVDPAIDEQTLERMARELPAIQKWTDDKQVRKVIVVPGKLVNIVVG
jgi:leucyl-tRNA synthetase